MAVDKGGCFEYCSVGTWNSSKLLYKPAVAAAEQSRAQPRPVRDPTAKISDRTGAARPGAPPRLLRRGKSAQGGAGCGGARRLVLHIHGRPGWPGWPTPQQLSDDTNLTVRRPSPGAASGTRGGESVGEGGGLPIRPRGLPLQKGMFRPAGGWGFVKNILHGASCDFLAPLCSR